MKEYIKEKLKSYSKDNNALEKYIKVCEYFEKNDVKHKYIQWHHIIPSFLIREENDLKNRSYTIDLLDEQYPPEDNVIKIDNQYHVIAHYYLAKAFQTKDAENAFRIFDDWTKEFNEYSEKDAIQLGLDFKETSQPNSQEKYLTNKEKEEIRKDNLLKEKRKNK